MENSLRCPRGGLGCPLAALAARPSGLRGVVSAVRSLRSLLDHRGCGVVSAVRSLRSLLDPGSRLSARCARCSTAGVVSVSRVAAGDSLVGSPLRTVARGVQHRRRRRFDSYPGSVSTSSKSLTVIVLAAGGGIRIKSKTHERPAPDLGPQHDRSRAGRRGGARAAPGDRGRRHPARAGGAPLSRSCSPGSCWRCRRARTAPAAPYASPGRRWTRADGRHRAGGLRRHASCSRGRACARSPRTTRRRVEV